MYHTYSNKKSLEGNWNALVEIEVVSVEHLYDKVKQGRKCEQSYPKSEVFYTKPTKNFQNQFRIVYDWPAPTSYGYAQKRPNWKGGGRNSISNTMPHSWN